MRSTKFLGFTWDLFVIYFWRLFCIFPFFLEGESAILPIKLIEIFFYKHSWNFSEVLFASFNDLMTSRRFFSICSFLILILKTYFRYSRYDTGLYLASILFFSCSILTLSYSLYLILFYRFSFLISYYFSKTWLLFLIFSNS